MIIIIKVAYYFAEYITPIADHFGPSRLRALPLAAGRNEGGNYFHYKNITALFLHITALFRQYNQALPEI